MFDLVLMADWSAASVRHAAPKADSIWIAQARREQSAAAPEHAPTRREAEARIIDVLERERKRGGRAILGLDYAFGYPAGFAGLLTGRSDARAVWGWLAGKVSDDSRNRNNRFAVADGINRMFRERHRTGGPFWGRPATLDLPDLPVTKPPLPQGLDRHRVVEHHLRGGKGDGAQVKSVWQLFYTGSVGGQVLVGLPFLHRLRTRFGDDLAVWPFDPPDKPIVVIEIYPGVIDRAVNAVKDQGIKDAAQVLLMAEAVAALAADGGLGSLLSLPGALSPAERRAVETEEGWILGTGQAEVLIGALSRRSPPRGRSA